MIRALVVLAATATIAHAEPPKKDRELAAKTRNHGNPLAPGTKPHALINLFNEHTHEWLAVDPAAPPADADHFLRDHYTNRKMKMDRQLIPIVISAATFFHQDVVDIVSAFRHPKFNLILRKKGHQVARDSQHTHGNAIDFFLPNVPTPQLQAWAKGQKIGGVGLYMESGFVHMDIGPIRFWSGD